MPNTTLKAFQKNAVQSYFERQQQSTTTQKDQPIVRLNHSTNSNVATLPQSNQQRPQSLPATKTPANHMPMIATAQSRSSLPSKLSQVINISSVQPMIATELKPPSPSDYESMNNTSLGNSPFRNSKVLSKSSSASLNSLSTAHQPIYSTVTTVELQPKLHLVNLESRIMSIEQSNLQSANDSGVPPPPPRRTRSSMPVRRLVLARKSNIYLPIPNINTIFIFPIAEHHQHPITRPFVIKTFKRTAACLRIC